MLGALLIPAGFVLVIDQGSKKLVLELFSPANRRRPTVGWEPRLQPHLNTTFALGVRDRRALLVLWGFAALGIFALIFYAPAFQSWTARAGLGAAIGGATSNLIDWLRRGAIVDFIDLRVWPIFNLADAFIVLGVGVALWSVL
jgi:signal peptidase II